MIELAADRGRIRRWIICETGDRWLHSIRRFAPAMMPSPLIPVSLPSEPANVRGMLHRAVPAVVLWEVQRKSLAIACDHLAQTAINAPNVLQLVAGTELSDRERITLSEFQCAATIRHPEDLPSLAPLVHGYFATSLHILD